MKTLIVFRINKFVTSKHNNNIKFAGIRLPITIWQSYYYSQNCNLQTDT